MNPIHLAYVSRPHYTKLTQLWLLLEALDEDVREECMQWAINELTFSLMGNAPLPAERAKWELDRLEGKERSYEHEDQVNYERFKERCEFLAPHMHEGILAYGILCRTLAWLNSASEDGGDEKVIENCQGKITELHARLEGKAEDDPERATIESVIEKLEESVRTAELQNRRYRSYYNTFCERVILDLLRDRK